MSEVVFFIKDRKEIIDYCVTHDGFVHDTGFMDYISSKVGSDVSWFCTSEMNHILINYEPSFIVKHFPWFSSAIRILDSLNDGEVV